MDATQTIGRSWRGAPSFVACFVLLVIGTSFVGSFVYWIFVNGFRREDIENAAAIVPIPLAYVVFGVGVVTGRIRRRVAVAFSLVLLVLTHLYVEALANTSGRVSWDLGWAPLIPAAALLLIAIGPPPGLFNAPRGSSRRWAAAHDRPPQARSN